ncbi:hypothetical protein U1Q18_009149 [Sarracenia purpurea var. burkii]
MGLSTKQVSSDGLDWGRSFSQSGGASEFQKPSPATARRQQPQSESLACPRCGSTTTKFCYFNNYNKSQPRHFCKACKRHWTKGGTLRNVPVGGRKNKRVKTPPAAAATTTAISTCPSSSLPVCDQKNVSEILYQLLICPPISSQHNSSNSESFTRCNGEFPTSSTHPFLIQNHNPLFTFSSLSSVDQMNSDPSLISTSFRSSDAYNFTERLISTESTTNFAAVVPATTAGTIDSDHPWQIPTMDATNYWDDIDSLVSTDQLDINIWDDDMDNNEIKP